MFPIAPHNPCPLGIGNVETADERDCKQSYTHNPKNMRRGGTDSLSSEPRIMMISVPDAMKDADPENMGVRTIALICASVYMLCICVFWEDLAKESQSL